MNQPVVVTGLGPVSAIGSGRNDFWVSLVAGRHGFGPITLCDTSLSPSKVGTEVKDFSLERYITHGEVMARRQTGLIQAKWSEEHNPRFAPAEEYLRPLPPWEPRFDSQS